MYIAASNLANGAHVGSAIVNEANRRYYEPGAGRVFTAGMELRWY